MKACNHRVMACFMTAVAYTIVVAVAMIEVWRAIHH